MNYPSTPARIAAEAAWEADRSPENIQALKDASEAEMREVLAHFDSRHGGK